MEFLDLSDNREHITYIKFRVDEATMYMLLAYELNNMNFVLAYLKEINSWLCLFNFYYT